MKIGMQPNVRRDGLNKIGRYSKLDLTGRG